MVCDMRDVMKLDRKDWLIYKCDWCGEYGTRRDMRDDKYCFCCSDLIEKMLENHSKQG